MSALAALLAILVMAAIGPEEVIAYRPLMWTQRSTPAPPPSASKLAQSCGYPCTCQRLSRWTSRMRAHCVVSWYGSHIPLRHLYTDSSVDEIDFTRSTIHKLYGGHLLDLEHIKVIRMEGVRLASIMSNAFYQLPNLWSLSLAHNLLMSLPEQTFLQNRRLHYLSLRGNSLTVRAGQPLVTSSSLQVLDLADCRITAVDSATFKQLPSLRQLHLESNFLNDLPADAVAPVAQLTRLFLRSNRLLFFPSAAIQKLPQLLEVQLDDNKGMEGPLGPLEAPKLQRLTATGCSLQSIQPNLLATAPELRYLVATENRFSTLWLTNESPDAQLVLLDLTANPLECDCALRDSLMWAEEHVIESRVFCGHPPHSWHDAELHKLNCTLTNSTEAGAVSGGGGREAGAAVLWVSVSLLAVLAVVGGALLFVYRREVSARFFSPEARAAASGGGDVMPLERNHADDVAIGLPQEGGVAPWLGQ